MISKGFGWVKDRWKTSDYFFLAAFVGLVALYLWKLPLGNADIDETFYLSIPYRMAKGDSLIVHEWHVSQLWSFLLYPVMKIYLAVASGTEGIVLAFRYVYLFVHLTAVCIAYIAARKRYGMLAVAAVTLYGIFSPFDIMALSYNSMGLTMCFLLVFLNLERPEARWRHVLNGLLAAGLVLSNPYTVFLYIVYMMYLIAVKDKEALLYTNIGVGVLAALFFLVVFRRASLRELLTNFSYALSDSAHQKKTFQDFVTPIKEFGNRFFVFPVIFGLFSILAYKHKEGRRIWTLGLGGTALFMAVSFAVSETQGLGMCLIMFPLTSFGVALFLLRKEKDRRMLCAGILFPVMYAMCMHMSSNQGMYVIANACAVSSCVTVLLFGSWLNENFETKRQIAIILSVLFVCQAGAEIYEKTHHVFWEDGVDQLTEEITFGPLKGIHTTKEKKEKHESIIKDVKTIKASSDETILFYELMPCGYFVTKAAFGTYSAWTEDPNRMAQYYEVHPEKVPDIVYVFAETYGKWTPSQWDAYCKSNGYEMTQSGLGNYIMRR